MWHCMTKDEVQRRLRTNLSYGLTEEEAKKRQREFGKNKLIKKKKTNIFIRFLLQFNDFMIIALIIAAGVSAIMSFVEGSRRIHRFNHNYCDCRV